jgi:hypothetical protein
VASRRRGRTRRPTSWSHSAWQQYKTCPRQYKHARVERLPQPPAHPAMQRGIMIHAKAEGFLRGEVTGMPDELAKFSTELRRLRSLQVRPEEQWVITSDGQVTVWDDWDRAWCRAKIDAHHYFEDRSTLVMVDFKTGRVNPMVSQSELYAVLSRFFYPKAKRISVEAWFTDHGVVDSGYTYTPKEVDKLREKWFARAARMLSDTVYAAKPGAHCGRCPFRSNVTMPDGRPGPCSEWRRA